MDIHSKQQEDQRTNLTRELQPCRCRSPRITKDDRIGQKELLVARTQRRHQKICSRMLQVSIEQSPALEEIGRITPTRYITGTMARD